MYTVQLAELRVRDEKKVDLKFSKPEQVSRSREVMRMVALATKKAVETVVSRHYYSFRGKIYRQVKGGSI